MKRIIFIALCLITAWTTYAQKPTPNPQPSTINLQSSTFNIYTPSSGGDGRAIVLCPGGGYNHLAGEKEGAEWVPFFNEQGIAVVVTKYTLPAGDRNKPLNDIRETFRFLHEHASEYGINPNGIGIMGFSAGGHLASAYANSEWGELRPAFEILLYPVIRLDNKEHLGMAKKFLGDNVTDDERKAWSTNRMVTMETPKTIIITADDDPTIDPTNSSIYYEALKRNHVQASLHIYPSGGHGFGFKKSFPYHEEMKKNLTDWLKTIQVANANAMKVACIGNSITYGARLKYRDTESWPAQLQVMLGKDYNVRNYGNSGATMTNGDRGYMKEPPYKYAKIFAPDLVFIKLGTNDVQPLRWQGEEAFTEAYQQMVDELKALPSHPKIVLCLPATSYREEKHVDAEIAGKTFPLIQKIAKKNKLDVIDLHTPTANHPELFPDKLHPNAEGEKIIAETIFQYMKKNIRK